MIIKILQVTITISFMGISMRYCLRLIFIINLKNKTRPAYSAGLVKKGLLH